MYNDLLGRKMNLRYRRTLYSYPGIKAYRYTFDVNNFKNSIDYPPNSCYTSRLPKEMFDIQSNGSNSNNQAPNERSSNSAGSLLLNLARRRFENTNNPLANLFNRNILSRPLVSVSNPATNSPSTTTTTTTTTTPDTETNNDGEEQPVVEELENSRNNPAESLIMTTTESNNNHNLLKPSHSNPVASVNSNNNIQQSTTQSSRENHISHPDDSSMPRDANLFSRTNQPESRQDQFSSLGTIFSNRVRDSPLLALFAPRDQLNNNNSPDNNSRLNGRLFNRNGNNILGNLISNGLNRLLNLRNARRMQDDINRNDQLNNSNDEPTNRSVLSRSVRNAFHRRVTRNTGPISNGDTSGNINNNDYENINGRSTNNRTTHEDYIALRKRNMFPSGAFDFSEIAFGAPILLSQPHFLNADPYYRDRVSKLLLK